jgi:outer membrane protein assembly factor BamB
VYFDGGEYGGLYALSEADGSQVFFAHEGQYDSWSPLFFDGSIYTFVDGSLRMFDPVAGSLLVSATVNQIWNGYSMNTSPVSDGNALYLISPPNLYAFSPTLGAPLWTANGSYSSQPAVAGGVVYSISAGQLRANDAQTGNPLWTFPGDSKLAYPPVVAGGYVYVASDANVFAVEIANQAQAWADTPGGWLSIAGGQLLVAGRNGTLVAWSLTH